MIDTNTTYSYRSELRMKNVKMSQSGSYVCRANLITDNGSDPMAYVVVNINKKE